MTNYINDPYHIATMGQNSIDTFTLASNGFIFEIEIEDVLPDDQRGGGGRGGRRRVRSYEAPVVKRVKVTVEVDGEYFSSETIVEDKPDLKVEDLHIEVGEDNKPIITIKDVDIS